MAKDLVNRQLLLGKHRSEIVQMLGDPERYSDTKTNEMFYRIREDYPFMGIDPERRDFLEITLDANEKAENVVITGWTIRKGENPAPLPVYRSK